MQLMDAAFPGQIPLSKANFNAQYDYEFSGNFKILQTHFVKIKCDKVVPTDRLIKAKYQDNLEFMQWMKRFFEMQYSGDEYDAKARRKECKCEHAGDKASGSSKPKTAATATTTTTSSRGLGSGAAATEGRRTSMMPGTGSSVKPAPTRQSLMPGRTTTSTRPTSVKLPPRDDRVDELTKMCSEITIELGQSETTRAFYLNKLRAIETLMDELVEENETVESLKEKVTAILFSEE